MNFNFDGRKFKLTFEHQYRNINQQRSGRIKTVRSKHPYTTAKLQQLAEGAGENVVIGVVSVGCYKLDKYDRKLGNYYAIVKLGKFLQDAKQPKELRRALWRAYWNRGITPATGSGPAGSIVDAVSVTQVLPDATENNGIGTALLPSDLKVEGESRSGYSVH